ncbi:MAG: acyl-CoA dehydrogenase [Pseudonocardiaceae bacterium]|nr:acyl-CoA dehydrogenase [Pseudonocardiaceae bacterium]
MRFALTPEQRQFAASLDDLLGAADVPAAARCWVSGEHGPVRDIWRRLGELGATALAVPERYDGLDAHPVDLVVAFEAFGRHALPGPLVESLAVLPILLDEHSAAARWLPDLAAGKRIATVALPPHVPYALDAGAADVVFEHRDGSLRLVEGPGEALRSVDPARSPHLVGAGASLGQVDAARAWEFGVLTCTAQLLGAGLAMLETTREYAAGRRQFGRPIGAFQAVKHQLADVLVGLELARPLLYGAAVALADGAGTAGRDTSAAKIATGVAAHRAARAALQVHGALGYTQEYDLSLWLTKVRALKSAWGTDAVHRARVMDYLATESMSS